jgi:hypothetical protein
MPLFPEIASDFHERFRAWARIEPRCRSNDFSRGIQARIADPLWMLTRQWQVGEFQGEDAGSPVQVEMAYETQSVETVKLGSQVIELRQNPLETLVEQERLPLDWHVRVRIGQSFERLLRQPSEKYLSPYAEHLIRYYRQQFPIQLPPDQVTYLDRATARFIKFMSNRVVDGQPLLAAARLPLSADILPSEVTRDIFEHIQTSLHRLQADLKTRYAQYHPSPNGAKASEAWRSQHLHYRFELNPTISRHSQEDREARPLRSESRFGRETLETRPDFPSPIRPIFPTRLIAPDYRNGDLDWYSFAVQSGIQGRWTQHQPVQAYPTAIRITGTSPRWWAFEDANTDFGALDVAKPDLAKLLLMEFVLIYGDDWFSLPLTVPMANLVRLKSLQVSNVFGEVTAIESAQTVVRNDIENMGGDPDDPLLRWSLFSLSPSSLIEPGRDGNDPDLASFRDVLFIPPVAGFREESSPLEEIRFLRDEGANMVWAVEHTILNGLGQPVDGFEAQLEQLGQQREAEIVQLQAKLTEVQRRLEEDVMTDSERADLEAEVADLQRRIEELKQGAPPAAAGAGLHYRLASLVPENWIPFKPHNASAFLEKPAIRLRRAQMVRNAVVGEPEPIEARSRLLELAGDPLLWLEEATVPRAGLRLQLTHQRMRWVDGKTYVWVGRKVLIGRGEGSSGLRFDMASTKRE